MKIVNILLNITFGISQLSSFDIPTGYWQFVSSILRKTKGITLIIPLLCLCCLKASDFSSHFSCCSMAVALKVSVLLYSCTGPPRMTGRPINFVLLILFSFPGVRSTEEPTENVILSLCFFSERSWIIYGEWHSLLCHTPCSYSHLFSWYLGFWYCLTPWFWLHIHSLDLIIGIYVGFFPQSDQ